MSRPRSPRLLSDTAAAFLTVVCIVCIAAVWIMPRPAAAATAAEGRTACRLITGPARLHCTPALEDPALVPASATAPAGIQGGHLWLLLFSTAAVASAVALATVNGRHRR